MAEKHRPDKDPEKTVDMPPYGSRNPDPITDAAGSHPIETGIGAALGGVASGAAVGAVGGPVGAVIGAAVGGAIAGGLAGKGVGELIDPTTEDNWLREYFHEDKTHAANTTEETYRPAYHYGVEAGSRHYGRKWDEVEPELRNEWSRSRGNCQLNWDQARGAAHNAFDRTIRLHEERLKVSKEPVRTGEVNVRKEVHTENKTVTVPVEREEVVIEHRPATGRTATGDFKAEEIRIPVHEEKVNVTKEAVVKEEVNVGKRTVHDTKTVSDDVRSEELKIEEKGDAKVRREK